LAGWKRELGDSLKSPIGVKGESMTPIENIPVDIHCGDYKPEDWRKHPEPDDIDADDDEDLPCPPDVEMVLGFNPDEEDVEEATDEA
jgi:hypothetical protein